MKLAVILRHVVDSAEQLVLSDDALNLDSESVSYVLNEPDSQALEQALLIKEKIPALVTVFSLDRGRCEESLIEAGARGVDRLVKLTCELPDEAITETMEAELIAEALKTDFYDLILVGDSSPDELTTHLPATLGVRLDLPYIGSIRAVEVKQKELVIEKEFEHGLLAIMTCIGPIILGISSAASPLQEASTKTIRETIRTREIEEISGTVPSQDSKLTIAKLSLVGSGISTEMLEGDMTENIMRVLGILTARGSNHE